MQGLTREEQQAKRKLERAVAAQLQNLADLVEKRKRDKGEVRFFLKSYGLPRAYDKSNRMRELRHFSRSKLARLHAELALQFGVLAVKEDDATTLSPKRSFNLLDNSQPIGIGWATNSGIQSYAAHDATATLELYKHFRKQDKTRL